jgi:hypothetical protein
MPLIVTMTPIKARSMRVPTMMLTNKAMRIRAVSSYTEGTLDQQNRLFIYVFFSPNCRSRRWRLVTCVHGHGIHSVQPLITSRTFNPSVLSGVLLFENFLLSPEIDCFQKFAPVISHTKNKSRNTLEASSSRKNMSWSLAWRPTAHDNIS